MNYKTFFTFAYKFQDEFLLGILPVPSFSSKTAWVILVCYQYPQQGSQSFGHIYQTHFFLKCCKEIFHKALNNILNINIMTILTKHPGMWTLATFMMIFYRILIGISKNPGSFFYIWKLINNCYLCHSSSNRPLI